MTRIGSVLGRLAGKLGVVVGLAGFVLVYLGWNGAASFDDVRQQFPYLLSGGVGGLALVVVGAALVVVEAVRAEGAALSASMDALREAIERAAPAAPVAAGSVVAGASSFHQPTCRTVAGRTDLELVGPDEAVARGLSACRVCQPA